MSAVTMDHTGVGVVCLWLSAAMCVHGETHYVNLALNKEYQQSSKQTGHPSSSSAANGDTSGEYPANCIHTDYTDTNNPWWEVDLGRTYPVYNMDVWARDGYCQAGWYGKQCNTACSVGCKDAVCDRQTGHCSECKTGFHGPSCHLPCQHQCLNNECIKDSGLCAACRGNFQGPTCSECKSSFYGPSCNLLCQHQCLNNECIKDSGLCAACPGNFQGPTCSECKAGFYGPSCNFQCQYHCLKNECTRGTGLCEACPENHQGNTCSECTAGFYGQSCNKKCPPLCLNNVCDKTTGRCAACPDGYRGDTCSECKAGFYGPSCDVSCQHQCLNNECIKDTGLCEACPGNFQGNTCSAKNNDGTANTPAIIGAVVGTGLLLCVCIIVLSVVMWFRRSRDSALRKRNEVNEMDTSVPPTSSRPASTDRGQTSAVSQGTEDGPEHYEPVDMSEQNERVVYEPVDMAEAENGVHSDDLTATSHKTEADSANPYDTPAVQYHNTGDVHLYHSWGNLQAFQ